MLTGEAIRHAKPRGECPSIGHGGHTKLATCSLVPTSQHEELIAASVPLVAQPFLVAGVAVLRKVALLPPQPLRPEARSNSPLRNISFQRRRPGLQGRQPAPFLAKPAPAPMLSSTGNLPLGPSNPPAQAVHLQLQLLPTDATFPSGDTRTSLTTRAGIPYRLHVPGLSDAALPPATSANSFCSTRPNNSA